MTALPLTALTPASAPSRVDAPVALAHLALTDPRSVQDAATELYRQTRLGRRVVAVTSGPTRLLARACDRLGLAAILAEPHTPELVHQPVVIVQGAVATRKPVAPQVRPLRVGLAGCGVVGGGLYARLEADPRFEIAAILVRDPRRRRDPQPRAALLVTSPNELLATSPDIVIDVLSDAEAGLFLTRAALARGIGVISANKQAIGPRLDALHALAESNDASFAYSAAVGGGAPIIETLLRARAHAPVARIEAVLNGTVNFLLNRLTAGCTFADAVADAQLKGFAEADPSADLEGRDAAAKLGILSSLAFSGQISDPSVQKLCTESALPSGPVRQLARSDGRTASIAFEAVGYDPLFSDLPDEWNALRVTCSDGQTFICRGRGAGRWPTAESVWSDLLDMAEQSPA